MNKNIGIIAILILVVAAGGYFFMQKSANLESAIEENNSQVEETVEDQDSVVLGDSTITIADFAFAPQTITVKKGSTVIWTNEDSVGHTVTSDTGSELDSALLSKGQSYSKTFNQAGTFSYHCTPHPNMKGTVIVE